MLRSQMMALGILLLLGTGLVGAGFCRAQQVGLADFGPHSVRENFDSFSNGTVLTGQIPGATLENMRVFQGFAVSQPNIVSYIDSGRVMKVLFSSPVFRVGINWDADGACCNRRPTMNVYDTHGQPIGSHSTNACCEFWGFQSASGIARIEFTYPGGGSSDGYDNLIFEPLCPLITRQATSISACTTGKAEFVVAVAGVGPLTYQWQYEVALNIWDAVPEGEIASSNGVTTASNVETDHLQLALNTTHGAPPIRFRCVVTNSCGSVTSDPATLVPCQSDLTCDNVVDDADFVVFAAAYNVLDCADAEMAAGCPADLNGDGLVDDADFVQFVAAYNSLGCL